METDSIRLKQIEADLGLNVPFVKGQQIPVNNCWHFSTDGNAVDAMFIDELDFCAGMNRIYPLFQKYAITILAFSLMDTHVHFILYGPFDQCNRFIHDYVKQTSWSISHRHGDRHKFRSVPINHQVIDTDRYLKTAICYVIKNAPVSGIPYNSYDYPWSSGALYFRHAGYWTSPNWSCADVAPGTGGQEKMIFPGDYVDYHLVERIFKTHRSFNFFMCVSKESDVEERGGSISLLSMPMQEMRQHKTETCKELFGVNSIRTLSMAQRLHLARVLKSRYNSSSKQLARLCGLVYKEVCDKL
ncbi:MAG: hypothetical protein J6Y83_02055 [Bacteroidales bacterium]|nr:hypothetical protein [Bacteroidales bacterium]